MDGTHEHERPSTNEVKPTGGSLISRLLPSPGLWRALIAEITTPLGLGALVALLISGLLGLLIVFGDITGNVIWGFLILCVLIALVLIVFIVVRDQPLSGTAETGETTTTAPENDLTGHEGVDVTGDIVSALAIIEVMTQEAEDASGEAVVKTVVKRISSPAKQFFGYAANHPTRDIVGQDARVLMARLARLADPPSAFWTDLQGDQGRVYAEVEDTSHAYSRVPVKFNRAHEFFPGKTFVPVITEFEKFPNGGADKTRTRVLYLDVDKLPRTLFTANVWNTVIDGFCLKDLATDFGRISDQFSNMGFPDEDDNGVNRKKSLVSAVERLRGGSDPETLEDLSKAGWFKLREVAQEMSDRPVHALQFIKRILMPEN